MRADSESDLIGPSPRSRVKSTVKFAGSKPSLKHLARLMTVINKAYPHYHPVVVCKPQPSRRVFLELMKFLSTTVTLSSQWSKKS